MCYNTPQMSSELRSNSNDKPPKESGQIRRVNVKDSNSTGPEQKHTFLISDTKKPQVHEQPRLIQEDRRRHMNRVPKSGK